MKNRSMFYLSAFVAFIMLVSLACNALTPTSTEVPATNLPAATPATSPPATEAPQSGNSGSNGNTGTPSSALVTFTDKNQYYQIQIPGDWVHTHNSFTRLYTDRFASPDGNALVENITYNDGTSTFTGSQNGKFALQILNQIYSKTGQEGDIHVTKDSIGTNGDEDLTWHSTAGAYSGDSFFEIRGSDRKTFLMFTINWADSAHDQYFDTLSTVVSSYKVP